MKIFVVAVMLLFAGVCEANIETTAEPSVKRDSQRPTLNRSDLLDGSFHTVVAGDSGEGLPVAATYNVDCPNGVCSLPPRRVAAPKPTVSYLPRGGCANGQCSPRRSLFGRRR